MNSKDESYFSHDKIVISIKENVANNLNPKLKKQLRKARFGYSVGTSDFRGRFGTDEVYTIEDVEDFLKEHKIKYTKTLLKANLESYVSNT